MIVRIKLVTKVSLCSNKSCAFFQIDFSFLVLKVLDGFEHSSSTALFASLPPLKPENHVVISLYNKILSTRTAMRSSQTHPKIFLLLQECCDAKCKSTTTTTTTTTSIIAVLKQYPTTSLVCETSLLNTFWFCFRCWFCRTKQVNC